MESLCNQCMAIGRVFIAAGEDDPTPLGKFDSYGKEMKKGSYNEILIL